MHDISNAEEVLTNLRSFRTADELSTVEGAVLPIEHWPLARILGASSYTTWSCVSGAWIEVGRISSVIPAQFCSMAMTKTWRLW